MIRTIRTGTVKLLFARCDECKTESDNPLITGIESDTGTSYAIPRGWMEVDTESCIRFQKVRLQYCPRCSVAKEYRK